MRPSPRATLIGFLLWYLPCSFRTCTSLQPPIDSPSIVLVQGEVTCRESRSRGLKSPVATRRAVSCRFHIFLDRSLLVSPPSCFCRVLLLVLMAFDSTSPPFLHSATITHANTSTPGWGLASTTCMSTFYSAFQFVTGSWAGPWVARS